MFSGKEFLDKVKLGRENLTKIKTGLFTKDYEVIGELGTGSYGSVKKVRHKKLPYIAGIKKNHFLVFHSVYFNIYYQKKSIKMNLSAIIIYIY